MAASETVADPARPTWRLLLGLTVAYVAAARVGFAFADVNDAISAVWAPTGIALAAVLLWGPGAWPAIATGALLANLTNDLSLTALPIAAGNTAEALIGAAIVTRFAGWTPTFVRISSVPALAAGAVPSTLVSALIGVTTLRLAGDIPSGEVLVGMRTWWFGDLTGDLIVAPVLLVFLARPRDAWRAVVAPKAVLVITVGLAIALVLLVGRFELDVLLLAPVVAVALYLRQPGAVLVSLGLSAIAVWLTATGHGPFSNDSREGDLLEAQLLAAVAALSALVAAAVRTERASSREALMSSDQAREWFEQVLETAPDAMIVAGWDGTIALANAQAEAMLGYRREELIGAPVEMLIPETVRGRHARHRERYGQEPTPRPMGATMNLRARHRDGREIPVEISLSPLHTASGTLVSAAIRDVTERRQSERALRDTAMRMAEAQAIAAFGNWEWSVDGDEFACSAELARIHGIDEAAGAEPFRSYLRRVHPDDRAEVETQLRAAVATGGGFSFDERIVLDDGSVRRLRSQGRAVRADDGHVDRVIGVSRDVTQLHEAEAAVHEAQERFRNAFENAPIGIAIVAMEGERFGHLLDANRALRDICGREEDELLTLKLDSLTHPEDRGTDADHVRGLLAGTFDSFTVEKRLIHSQGQTVWVLVNASLMRDPDGTPMYAILQLQDITERKRFEGQLQYLADHDPLTGLFNRRRFQHELEQQLAFNARYGGEGAVLVIDLDRFKYVNDTLGHGVGDDLLRQVAALLRERLRASDVIARLGGDEFAVLLPQERREEALALATSLGEQIGREAIVQSGDRAVRVSASIGVTALAAAGSLSAEEALMNADIAMYQAKEHGRDRVEFLDLGEEPQTRMRARLTWSERVRDALDQDRFELVAQPILEIRTGQIRRYELLLRMIGDGPSDLIPPGAFLHIAEEFGMIGAVDRWVVGQAVDLLSAARAAGQDFSVSVNLSAASITEQEMLDHIEAELGHDRELASRLVFEVTETAAIVNIGKANRFALRLGELGCRMALDDFGSGFGSFYYLKHVPFDELKIDGDFIRKLPESHADQLTVKAIVQIAQGLGRTTVAEFVENQATLDLLREFRVDFAQGYHVGRPMTVAALLASLEQSASASPPNR